MGPCSKCGRAFSPEAFYANKSGGYRSACKDCIRKAERERQRARRAEGGNGRMRRVPLPVPTPTPEPEDGKTAVINSCGHEYRYTIKRPSAVRWLETQPCPRCRKDGGSEKPARDNEPDNEPEGNEPEGAEPEPEMPVPAEPEPDKPEPDEAWVQEVAAMLPDEPFHAALPDVLLALRAGLPLWLQGPPGTSKSTVAQQAATALGLGFFPVSCHEMMTRSDLFGFTDANGNDHRTPLWNAYEHGGVCLLDEVDNGNPNLLAALNSALSNGHCVFGSGTVVQRHADFRVVATANTAGLGPEHGFIGRNGVDLATRDRFITLYILIDNRLEDALAALSMGDEVDARPFKSAAVRALRKRSVNETPDRETLLSVIRKARSVVESRYRGTVVSPRATLHVGAMCAQRFTLTEALAAKLPGLTPSDALAVIREAVER